MGLNHLCIIIISVGPATDNYRLSISGFTGITPTDPFATHNIIGWAFSTYIYDKDKSYYGTCGVNGHGSTAPGGWWHRNCFHINLNYNYGGPLGFIYLDAWYSPQYIEMKIRPVDCKI